MHWSDCANHMKQNQVSHNEVHMGKILIDNELLTFQNTSQVFLQQNFNSIYLLQLTYIYIKELDDGLGLIYVISSHARQLHMLI